MPIAEAEEKPKRLYFKSYLRLIRNSVGSQMFRNFYVWTSDRGEFDAFADGELSCAFYVSSVLVIFNKIDGMHGTVVNVQKALAKHGWLEVNELRAGDVLVWEPVDFGDGTVPHIGFAIGDGRAVSTSWKQRQVVEHDINFGENKRKIHRIYRHNRWDDDPQTS